MNDIVKKDLLNFLPLVLNAVKKLDSRTVKKLSNHTVHDASTIQDTYSITFAILIYSLAKIMEREEKRDTFDKWKQFRDKISAIIAKMIFSLRANDIVSYESNQKNALNLISNFDKKYSDYVRFVLEKAKIKKAAHIYEHGISLGRVSELLGISKYELMSYIGATKVHELKEISTKSISSRLKIANNLFKEDNKNE